MRWPPSPTCRLLPLELGFLLLAARLADDVARLDRHYLTRIVHPRLRRRGRNPDDELPLRDGAVGRDRLRLALQARRDAVVDGERAALNGGHVPDHFPALVGRQSAEAIGVGLRGLGSGRRGLAGELRKALLEDPDRPEGDREAGLLGAHRERTLCLGQFLSCRAGAGTGRPGTRGAGLARTGVRAREDRD